MKLTDRTIKALKPSERPYKRSDGGGLTLVVKPNGQKLWWFRYRFNGKPSTLGFGPYPYISLARAREQREKCRELLFSGQNPSAVRRLEKQKARRDTEDTFANLAEEFVKKREAEGAAWRTVKKHHTLLRPLLKELGQRPIREITPQDLLDALRVLERSDRVVMAQEARALTGRIYRFAIAQGRADTDIAAAIKDALRTPVVKQRAGITDPDKLGQLLVDIEGYQGAGVTRNCLLLLARLFVRPGELREARWSEIDLSAALWRIPAERTKLRRDHLVPLPPQAIVLFEELHAMRANDELVAGSSIKPGRPISDMTFNKALRSLGYDNYTMVAHGFRTTASTLLNEQGYNSDWIERQLAHVERNKVRGAYNTAEYLEGRRRMVTEWNTYLDTLTERTRLHS